MRTKADGGDKADYLANVVIGIPTPDKNIDMYVFDVLDDGNDYIGQILTDL